MWIKLTNNFKNSYCIVKKKKAIRFNYIYFINKNINKYTGINIELQRKIRKYVLTDLGFNLLPIIYIEIMKKYL